MIPDNIWLLITIDIQFLLLHWPVTKLYSNQMPTDNEWQNWVIGLRHTLTKVSLQWLHSDTATYLHYVTSWTWHVIYSSQIIRAPIQMNWRARLTRSASGRDLARQCRKERMKRTDSNNYNDTNANFSIFSVLELHFLIIWYLLRDIQILKEFLTSYNHS